MSSEVLARKYRPQLFSEVVGQDHIVAVLHTQNFGAKRFQVSKNPYFSTLFTPIDKF